ncbi:MAG: hypothetical protein Q9M16_09405 [Mariprofundus sp.]|nr:hypothetical protein [Mariprofundus sp.]
MLVLLLGCQGGRNMIGLVIAPGWTYHSLGAWKQMMPNKMALDAERGRLYFGSELSEYSNTASVAVLDVKTGRTQVLVEGLRNVLGLHFAPDKSLWVAEGEARGEIWRMLDPAHFPEGQRVIAQSGDSTYPGFAAFLLAGHFAHRAIAFSADQHKAYLADTRKGGCLYRFDFVTRSLAVWHAAKGWLTVEAEDTVTMALHLGAQQFAAISDIERLPDGTLLLAESGAGRILQLHDSVLDNGTLHHEARQPTLSTWLEKNALRQPVDMSWDASRGWLWITDDATPSTLWAWDGHSLYDVVHHPVARISGVLAAPDGKVYVNLQRSESTPSITFVLNEKTTRSP